MPHALRDVQTLLGAQVPYFHSDMGRNGYWYSSTSIPPIGSVNKELAALRVSPWRPKHGTWTDTYPGLDHVLKPHQRCATGRGHVPKPVHPFVQLGVKGLSIAHRDPLRPADSSLSYPRPPSQPRVSAEPSGRSGEAAWPRLGRGGGVVSVLPDRRGPPKAAAVRRGNGSARRRRGRHCSRQHLPGHGRR